MEKQGVFETSRLSDGHCMVKLLADKLTGECTLTSLVQELTVLLPEFEDTCVLDITALHHHFPGDIDELTPVLLQFLTSGKPQNAAAKRTIVTHEKQCAKVRGKVSGALMNKIKATIGDTICLPGISATLKTRDLFNAGFLEASIVSDNPTENLESIKSHVEALLSLDFSQVPVLEKRAIITAYKKLLAKMKRSDGVEKAETSKSSDDESEETKPPDSPAANSSQQDCPQNQGKSQRGKKCYICKQLYFYPKKEKLDEISRTYPRLCRKCGELNFKKRTQKADLTGKYAVVTGGRIKIGLELVLKLLRDGCHVITTTRFPHDAAKRYAAEKDFNEWKDRLHVYALDLKDIPGVYKFVNYVKETFPHLDILINNAAQTIRRPIDFFRELMDYECIPRDHVPRRQQDVLVQQEALNYGYYKQQLPKLAAPPTRSLPTVVELGSEESEEPTSKRIRTEENVVQPTVTERSQAQGSSVSEIEDDEKLRCESNVPVMRSTSLDSGPSMGSMDPRNTYATPSTSRAVSLGPGSAFSHDVIIHTGSTFSSMARYFPRGATDADGQQLDLRRKNSWRMLLEDVSASEVIEILVVNVIAPFLLNKELKPLLCKSPANRKFIVNVSAMEGQFNRKAKTKFHPHTNMGKAALNMMTRTAALGYKEKDIYMTSVDTGWVTDERPFHMAKHEQRVKGFKLPLDNIDGAARIYDPIVTGLTDMETVPHYAVFLKDYFEHPW